MKIFTVIKVDPNQVNPQSIANFKTKKDARKYAKQLAQKLAKEHKNMDPWIEDCDMSFNIEWPYEDALRYLFIEEHILR